MHHYPNAAAQISEAKTLRAMFAARKRVFVDMLKWDLPVLAGEYELDQFDDPEARYLILTDTAGNHRASARLLRTDRPHILGDLYPFLCAGPVPTGPTTREITRFCLDPRQRTRERREARNELVTTLAIHALGAGITDYTGVATVSWFDQIARFGWRCNRLGPPVEVCGNRLIGLHIRIDSGTCAALRETGIFRDSTLGLDDGMERAL
ncbi:MAG: acyl-homoserine-lactone synthase [Novosphingobium sp.]|nr:acyl-homoserine-lactone synthase [Novosphingobium sp.]